MTDSEGRGNNKIAKGKGIFQTQIPQDVIEEINELNVKSGIPKTIITEKLLRYGLKYVEEHGALPF